ncbi:hypothetical protein HIM_07596 [Hirsutella minnesotensis 3608]|uniref:FAD-binding FR-type domain-containing protein n=1 Tax=Hirsutella minnesotensis 3608 TaxID=1043627 RepID=A0A0F8A462_9HYPO|nr:hypothetical protein HIM_07596 [Hirsutella minnesotensis 3608]
MVAPVIQDQYTAARLYFASVVGLFLLESIAAYSLRLKQQTQDDCRHQTGVSHWKSTVLFHRFISSPIPIFGLNDLHVADVVRFVVFAALNVIFALNNNQYTTDYKLYGWLTIANGGLALLLAARNNLWSLVLRIPSSVLLQYHRWIGVATVAHATTHVAYNIMHYIATDQVTSSFASLRIQIGLAAWISLVIILVTAMPPVRRRAFELFYYAHFLFIVFVIGALVHTTKGPEFLLPGFGLWAIDRIIRFLGTFRKVEVVSVEQFAGDVTKFSTRGLVKSNPCQIVWAQLPGSSFLDWHPFTVMGSPDGSDSISSIAVRGLGRGTKRAQEITGQQIDKALPNNSIEPCSVVRLRLDGPYGVGRIRWGRLPLTILIAGGIGITPGISIISGILRDAAATLPASDIHQKTQMSSDRRRFIHLLWVIRDITQLHWFEKELQELGHLSSEHLPNISLQITIHVTGNVKIDGQDRATHWSLKLGRPDVKSWLNDIKQSCPGMDAAPPQTLGTFKRSRSSRQGRDGSIASDITCAINPASFTYGMNNVVFKVAFSNDVYWIARIHHAPVDPSQARENAMDMLSEIATMRTLNSRTTIPVPQVFAFDVSPTNGFGFPYILMEYLKGQVLDSTNASAVPAEHLPHAASQLADVLFQLENLSFDQLGRIWCGESCDEPPRIITWEREGEPSVTPHNRTSLEWFYEFRQQENRRALEGHADDPEWRTAGWVLKTAQSHIIIEDRLHGPFPLCHFDLHYGNLLFDDHIC